MKEIAISTDYIALDQFLKFAGISETGGKAKEIILKGNVKVNKVIENKRKKKLYKNDIVEVNNQSYIIK
ncbi:RNA-binding S4 domain-containing protein [Aceticella autotrophica]|jgi:ribosome-associated protein|uniref:RNA-binding S4 domain-containing protein n=1 Tax=Aceticella autotrophica TaxID=2755338 RepID=A0A975GAR8_9THEO|nr:RNA-binding S4 domain-containing protein [Aceticella autotrophica]MDI6605094.1 RNA-binding S4 domain-containing protein [Thermoanaerobacteraceae bacterium]QSZ27372.1 RNA-binding S4 domain-containing protein [Aceticella autotrophica]